MSTNRPRATEEDSRVFRSVQGCRFGGGSQEVLEGGAGGIRGGDEVSTILVPIQGDIQGVIIVLPRLLTPKGVGGYIYIRIPGPGP